jgi:sterol desaturase/sphingolipid hydroxylase (fatty acid hydroxylase superfamily)
VEALYASTIGALQTWLFETIVQPTLFAIGWIALDETAFEATEWFILGALEIALLYAILRPLEARFPAERWADRAQTRVDVLYTFLHRLGFVPLAFFLALTPLHDGLESWLRTLGFTPYNLEDLIPPLAEHAILSFIVYVVVLDLAEYWRHRLSHRFEWWWQLHALHHSQRQMSFWADNRNHLLDDLTQSLWLAAIAIVIGIPPGQFFLAVILTRSVESLSHANLRLSFGAIGERLLVSPRFHRVHHAIGIGHEGVHRGCNFAVLFPAWDVLFGTANFDDKVQPTGVRDQLEGRDYGRGFWSQQWLGLLNMLRALRPGPALRT